MLFVLCKQFYKLITEKQTYHGGVSCSYYASVKRVSDHRLRIHRFIAALSILTAVVAYGITKPHSIHKITKT